MTEKQINDIIRQLEAIRNDVWWTLFLVSIILGMIVYLVVSSK